LKTANILENQASSKGIQPEKYRGIVRIEKEKESRQYIENF
jgi:hypothetical protein